MINTTDKLPEHFSEIYKIELKKNKNAMIFLNLLAVFIFFVMMIIGLIIYVLPYLFSAVDWDFESTLIKSIVLLVGIFAVFILHELIHAIFIKAFSGIKPKYGITIFYTYLASPAYFSKTHFIFINFAPIVILGFALLALNLLLPPSWSWIVFIIQTINIVGSTDDLYIIPTINHFSDDVLIKNTGIEITVYADSRK